MVSRLPVPLIDDVDYLTTVIGQREDGRNREYFAVHANWWQQRIAEYNQHGGDPTRIAASTVAEIDKGKYLNLYGGGPADHLHRIEIGQLRERNRDIMYCPSCGEDGTPRTLDHHLPKTVFPEYSVHLKNLVPMCDICQEIKGTTYVTPNGLKHFYHPYFDAIPDAIFTIDINRPFSAPTFAVRTTVPNPIDAVLADNHAKGLGLYARIEKFCIEKYVHLLKIQSQNRQRGNTDIAMLLQAFLDMEEQKSSNGWAATFYRSVIRNVELLDYLTNGVLPGHL